MGIAEDYIEKLKASEEDYHWPIEAYNDNQEHRVKTHKVFPYVVTLEGLYEFHDEIEDWCRKEHGSRHGKCQWEECEFSYDRWHKETGLEASLSGALVKLRCGPGTNWRKRKKNNKKRTKIIHDHYDMVEERPDKPEKHSHKGIWTTVWIMKTGYDYGFHDYCFKNETDAILFAFTWKGEQ